MSDPSTYWLERLGHGSPDHGGYSVWRNVKDYGAVGDGVQDDTEAINRAIADGNRCGGGGPESDSSTTTPALVYIPSGTYLVSSPIVSYYYTSIVGDATNRPILKASEQFHGLAVIDENPYLPGGKNWYTPQNNFFRSVAHLVIDMTGVNATTHCSGIHHQVSQATGLRNVHFEMRQFVEGVEAGQRGIFMENGSGGHLSGCSVRGGDIGFWLGNQQFTVQDCHLTQCRTAISQHWNWTFVYHRMTISHCETAFEMRVSEAGAASVACLDWQIWKVKWCFNIVGKDAPARGSLVLSNVQYEDVHEPVVRSHREWDAAKTSGSQLSMLSSDADRHSGVLDWTWQGDAPATKENDTRTGNLHLPRSPEMLDEQGRWAYKARPEYLDTPLSKFVNVREHGAAGDGVTNDTAALQEVLDRYSDGSHVIWIPHGQYVLTHTLMIPPGARIVGEVWPVLLGTGEYFNDASNPRSVVQVGRFAGQEGLVEISECIFSTRGPCQGAIVLQWNLRANAAAGAAGPPTGLPGMWDTHIRLGGFKGSNLDDARFDADKPLDVENAWACFLAWYIPREANGCFVNNWIWLADHILDSDLDSKRYAGKQISLLAARGVLIEADPGPVLLWGGASEHFLLYQYQLHRARNVFIAHSQTETPYFLGEGMPAPSELVRCANPKWHDPQWTTENARTATATDTFDCRSWGFRILNSRQVHLYGPGLYSFFDNYKQDKLAQRRCQRSLLCVVQEEGVGENKEDADVDAGVDADAAVVIVNLNTIGAQSMLDIGSDSQGQVQEVIPEEPHRVGFTSVRGYWLQ